MSSWSTWERCPPGEALRDADPEIAGLIEDEIARQNEGVELIASENFVSPAVLEAMGSPLTNKYAEGLPGKRYYGGCEVVDVTETLAIERAKQLFGADHANVQPHSGAQANAAGFLAFLKPGDTFLGMRTWARTMCIAAGVRLVVHNPERILRDRGAVYACNHVSWFDVFAIASVLPRYTFIAKSELRKLPIFGYGAEAAGVVFLTRDNRKAAFESYQDAAKEVTAGKNVVVFPEGTRGRDYSLRPFKKGPFVLAIAAQAPVVPVLVYGAREAMPKGSFKVQDRKSVV